MKLPRLTCLRCGWHWIPRIADPQMCPHCKSARWDQPPVTKKETPAP